MPVAMVQKQFQRDVLTQSTLASVLSVASFVGPEPADSRLHKLGTISP